jgi:DNA-binding response OmpR family regulator
MGQALPSAYPEADRARILVTDDSEIGRTLLWRLLTRRGYAVTCAADGAETLEAASAAPPDLILLDLRLPDIDGSEVLRQIRAEYDADELPILMISGEHDGEVAAACLKLGANDFLMKPVVPALLYARVETYLRRQPSRCDMYASQTRAMGIGRHTQWDGKMGD